LTELHVAEAGQRRLGRQRVTSSYSQLSRRVRDQGLLGRTRGFYYVVFATLIVALCGALAGFVLLGRSWLQLVIAAALGIIFTQLAFLGHEAAHRQIFADGRTNDRAGRVLGTAFVGISYSWWMNKHSRHHGNPNRIGKDPDIEGEALAFYDEKAVERSGLRALMVRKQGYLFFPMLSLEGLNLHYVSVKSLLIRGDRPSKNRGLEIVLIAARFAVYLTVLFWMLPLGMAFAFLGVQLAVFGFYMGATFAPNHKGMPIIPADAKLDFFGRQVRSSRNITGRFWPSLLMGGLNYQVEHHLFPSMPRPHLARARKLVMAHCQPAT
jgi:fatty acid desaturase